MPRDPRTTPRTVEASGVPTWVRLGVLFLTVFVDLVGFGIVLPLLPLYADRFGASGTLIGVLVLSYSAAQLIFAPMWGRLSDRYGRRRILIIGLLGSTVSYVVFAYAGSIFVLLVSRVLAGVGGANVSVAQAYVADVTPPEKRAGNLGLIGAAFAMGFVFGPAIGGVLAPIAPELPGLVAACLCGANALLAVLLLPESLPKSRRSGRGAPGGAAADALGAASAPPRAGRLAQIRLVVADPGFRSGLVLMVLFSTAFSILHPTLPLFASGRFGLTATGVGWVMAFMGVFSAMMQGVLVRPLVARIGEAALIRYCSIPFVVGFVLLAMATSVPTLMLGMALLAMGFGGTFPSLVSHLSRAAPATLQGESLGVGQSAGALGRILGPLTAGVMWDLFGGTPTYLLAAGIGLAAGVWSLTLPNAAGSRRGDRDDPTDRPRPVGSLGEVGAA